MNPDESTSLPEDQSDTSSEVAPLTSDVLREESTRAPVNQGVNVQIVNQNTNTAQVAYNVLGGKHQITADTVKGLNAKRIHLLETHNIFTWEQFIAAPTQELASILHLAEKSVVQYQQSAVVVLAEIVQQKGKGPLTVGKKGADGDKGETGDKGEAGDKGETGDKGEAGDKGETGDQGEAGEKGDRGEKGEKGMKGGMGKKGLRGDKGENGEKGLTGDQGPIGEQGPIGNQGPIGEQGPRGPRGKGGGINKNRNNIRNGDINFSPVIQVVNAHGSARDGGRSSSDSNGPDTEQLQRELRRQEQELLSRQLEVSRMRNELETERGELERLRLQQEADLERQRNDLADRETAFGDEMQTRQREMDAREADIVRLEADIQTRETDLARLTADVQAREAAMANDRRELATLRTQANRWSQQPLVNRISGITRRDALVALGTAVGTGVLIDWMYTTPEELFPSFTVEKVGPREVKFNVPKGYTMGKNFWALYVDPTDPNISDYILENEISSDGRWKVHDDILAGGGTLKFQMAMGERRAGADVAGGVREITIDRL